MNYILIQKKTKLKKCKNEVNFNPLLYQITYNSRVNKIKDTNSILFMNFKKSNLTIHILKSYSLKYFTPSGPFVFFCYNN